MLLAAQIVGGLALLFLGGEWLVRGAVSLASLFKVSPLIIGLSVIAAGTSAPELFVSLVSALEGRPGIAIGNVVGSNVANILLVLGASALIWPVVVRRSVVRRDGLALIAATAVFCLLAIGGKIDRHFGIAMLILLFAYLYASYLAELKGTQTLSKIEEDVAELNGDRPVWLISVFLIGGFVGVIMGSNLLVEGAVGVATNAGVSETVIGVTLVALGTSLPELAASIAAARSRHTELALGNVIGSCIFNLLAIVGVVSTTISLDVPKEVVDFDLWVMACITVAFIAVSFLALRLGRAVGLGMLLLYGAYIAAQFAGLSAIPTMGQDG
ncbi:MAG: calcium/sodium antiporter [Rhodospirillaceae bacterium]|nr:calcium/sodium antiporter [Rhodospirillaceae bacterium]